MKRLNNKGYMLVEIILASALAFGLVYFILDLTIKLKNKNDDLMVETLLMTDQAIITNKLMEYAISEEENFSCDSLKIDSVNKTISYNEKLIDIVNKYTSIDNSCDTDISNCCKNELGKINITIPLDVKQMSDEDFDVIVDYKYKIGDVTPPTCTLSLESGGVITANCNDNENGSGIFYQGFDQNYNGDNETSKKITVHDTYTYYVKDYAGNEIHFDIKVTPISITYTCKRGYDACSLYNQYRGACYMYDYYDSYASERACKEKCSVTCNGSICPICHSGYTNTGSKCIMKMSELNACSSGTKTNGACYKYNQSSCGSWTVNKTNYNCNEGNSSPDKKYCYKITSSN